MLHMRILTKFLLFLPMFCWFMVSCRTISMASANDAPAPTESEITFQNAVNSGMVEDLIVCAKTYPEAKELVIEFLT